MLNIRSSLKPLVLVIASIGFTFSAHSMEQIGSPDKVEPIGHYGLDVPAKKALKSFMPKGWHSYVHKKLTLPDTLTWKSEDTFVQALERIEDEHNLIATVDWDTKAVYLRKKELTEINPTTTPPVPVADPRKEATLAVKPSEVAGLGSKPVDLVPHVSATTVATPPVPESNAVIKEYAVSAGYAKKIAEEAMSVVGYELLWDAPPLLRTDHALTLFRNAETDMKLILDAMGGTMSGLMAYISEDAKQVKVVFADLKSDMGKVYRLGGSLFASNAKPVSEPPATTALAPAQGNSPGGMPALLAEVKKGQQWSPNGTADKPMAQVVDSQMEPIAQPQQSQQVAPQGAVVPVVAGAVTSPMVAPSKLVLAVAKHTRLEDALEDFLKREGFSMKWAAPSGLEAGSDMEFKANDVVGMLNKILPRLRLEAEIFYDGDQRTVVILPATDIAIK